MLNFLSKNIFKIHHSVKFEYPIWKIIPAQSKYVICETRDIEKKSTKYHNVDLNSGKFKWQNHTLEEGWWVGIEGVFEDVIIFHKYERPDFPIHKGIIAIDLSTSSVLWENPDYKFIIAQGSFLYVINELNNSRNYLQIEIKSGNVIKEIYPEEISLVIQDINKQKDNVLYPESFYLDIINNTTIKKYFSKYKKQIHNEIEILRIKDLYFIGFSLIKNINDKILYTDLISIIDDNSKELFNDVLITEVSQAVFPKFFIKQDFLIYIRNKSILNICKLYEDIH